jgi:hypothetical protein
VNARAKWVTVFLLGGLWAGLVLWDLVAEPEPQRVPLTYVTGQKSSREAGRGKTETGLKIRMDLLEAGRRQAEGAFVSPKNIFTPLLMEKFQEKGSVARRTPSPPPSKIEPPPIPPGPTPEELAAQAALSELGQFRYLGYLNRQGRDEVFLSKGKELHIVRAGDTIEPRVLVKAVTPKDVILQETRSQVEKTILLAGEGK